MEPFCVALQRHLSSQHPLNVILKYHCRGVMVTNTIGSPTLITPGQYMDKLTPMGYKGTLLLLQRGYKTLSWQDSDFHLNIKVRYHYYLGSVPLEIRDNPVRGSNSDQCQISLCNVNAFSVREVMRIKYAITQHEFRWWIKKFSPSLL